MSRYLSFVANKWQLLTAIAASAGAADADKLLRTSSNGYLAIAAGGTGTGSADQARLNLGAIAPVTANDVLTWHEASVSAVAGTSYSIIFNIPAGGGELIGGCIWGVSCAFRLTIDGVTTINRTSNLSGRDAMGTVFTVVVVPPARATANMRLEAYNPGGISRDYGWRVATR